MNEREANAYGAYICWQLDAGMVSPRYYMRYTKHGNITLLPMPPLSFFLSLYVYLCVCARFSRI